MCSCVSVIYSAIYHMTYLQPFFLAFVFVVPVPMLPVERELKYIQYISAISDLLSLTLRHYNKSTVK